MTPEEYLSRCTRLQRRGLSKALADDLRKAGNVDLLVDLERAPDAALARLNQLHRERRDQAAPDPNLCPECGQPMTQTGPTYIAARKECEPR